MSLDGLSQVQARIATLQAQLGVTKPAATTSPRTTGTASSAAATGSTTAFDAAFQQALTSLGGTTDGTTDAGSTLGGSGSSADALLDPALGSTSPTLASMLAANPSLAGRLPMLSTVGAWGNPYLAQRGFTVTPTSDGGYLIAPLASTTSTAVADAGSTDTFQPPADLAAYGNGNIPTSALKPIGIGEHKLWAPAADAFTTMRDAAGRDGVTIGVTDSYRTYDQQVELAARKGLYQNGGLAAVPGTSHHGWGVAVDVDVNDQGLAWMRSHGAAYGFYETTPREPWHWEYRPDLAKAA